MATLTREQMESVIKGGGSIVHEGRVHTHVSTLPDEADLAKGDTLREDAAREAIDLQIAQLTAQRAKLGTAADDNQPAKGRKQATAADTLPDSAKDSNNSTPGSTNVTK